MVAHTLAYKIMMVTGIGVSLLNLNPLIKLDGYYIFCELIGEPDFKERTSAYLAGWTRKHLFGMPAEVEYIPLRRRPFYLVYAVLSAIYGYLLLTFLMGFTFNVLHSYSPAWAFAPAALMGYWVFRERIHSSGRFTKLFYLDKKERVWSWLKPWRFGALAAAVLLLLFLPIWPDFEEGAFVLEPARQAVVHAAVRQRRRLGARAVRRRLERQCDGAPSRGGRGAHSSARECAACTCHVGAVCHGGGAGTRIPLHVLCRY